MRGVPIRAVQELLGHSTIEMTTRYAHLSPDARRNAVNVLDVKEPIALTWTTSKGVILRIPLGQYSGSSRPESRVSAPTTEGSRADPEPVLAAACWAPKNETSECPPD